MPFSRKYWIRECILLPTLHEAQAERYRNFRIFLEGHREIHAQMAELEQMYYDTRPFTLSAVEERAEALFATLEGMVEALRRLSWTETDLSLLPVESLHRAAREALIPPAGRASDPLILGLDDISAERGRAVGGKAAHLGEVKRHLDLRIPRGFVLTTRAWHLFLGESGLAGEIGRYMAGMDGENPLIMEETCEKIRARILETPLPEAIVSALKGAVARLAADREGLSLAVRSSAMGEDGEASFAGQYLSVLHVAPEKIAEACKRVMASVFTSAAMAYRMAQGLDYRETPMAVLILEMVEPRLSGVLYTADPLGRERARIWVSALCGLGEGLVGGRLSPQFSWVLEKESFLPHGEGAEAERPLLRELWEMACRLESHFGRPLDVEWAVDGRDRLFLLQVRPLHPALDPGEGGGKGEPVEARLRMEGGRCAAAGLASGRVWVLENPEKVSEIPDFSEDTILVIPWASTAVTPWVRRVKGLIAEKGDMACHLASVAREFGVPALFDLSGATKILGQGEPITLWASGQKVYEGIAGEALTTALTQAAPLFASPLRLRMQIFLDLTTPLTLEGDAPEAWSCRTVHDIVRVCHDMALKAMLRFGASTEASANAVRLRLCLPFSLLAVDLGGGLRFGLTSCDEVDAYDVTSRPFRALWRGLTHPGIPWNRPDSGSAKGAEEIEGGFFEETEGNSQGYLFVSEDYLNLSVSFMGLFVTLDGLASDRPEDNYIHLQIGGGTGAYFDRSLRIRCMARVLERMGLETRVQSDFVEALLTGQDADTGHGIFEQLGRLLAASRWLDGDLEGQGRIDTLAQVFMDGQYERLWPTSQETPEGFYRVTGNWKRAEEGLLQEGTGFGSWFAAGVSGAMGRFLGRRYQDFLDAIGAYYYFPLLVARKSRIRQGVVRVQVKPLGGRIDQAGGLAFGIRDADNYFVFRINALEDNAILFEFKNGRRMERARVDRPVESGVWKTLGVILERRRIRAFLEEEAVMDFEADRELVGYLGLWTKADSVTLFRDLYWT